MPFFWNALDNILFIISGANLFIDYMFWDSLFIFANWTLLQARYLLKDISTLIETFCIDVLAC